MSRSENNSFNQFAIGFLIGAALGIFYAPHKGEETRKILKELLAQWEKKAREAGAQVVSQAKELKERAEPVIAEVKESVAPIVERVEPVITPIAQEIRTQVEEKFHDVVEPQLEQTKHEISETVEKAREQIRANLKNHPHFFRGV
jgi:gas vesicle protein